MGSPLKVEQFHGLVDENVPLFNRDPGWLKTLENFRVRPSGWLEARGGYEGIRPSGGTASPIAVGTFGSFFELECPWGVVIAHDGANFSVDIGGLGWFRLFGPINGLGAATIPPVIATTVLNRAWYFGSHIRFSAMSFDVIQGAGGGAAYTVVWEYWNGAAWVALPGVAEQFTTAGVKSLVWTPPSDWAATSVGGALDARFLYWVRVRVSVAGACPQDVWCQRPILSDWSGSKRLIATRGKDPGAGAAPVYYSQSPAGVVQWNTLMLAGTGPSPVIQSDRRTRMASLDGRLYVTSFIEKPVVVHNNYHRPIGFPKPSLSAFTITPRVAGPPNFSIAGTFDYGITLGYGPNGRWGESNITMSTAGPTAIAANQVADLAWTFTALPDVSVADRIYIYKTGDLTGVPVSERPSVPMFRISYLERTNVPGTLPDTTTAAINFTDLAYGVGFPEVDLDIVDNSPPPNARYIAASGGRLFLAASKDRPNRAWWSKLGEAEAFDVGDQSESYVDLRNPITGMVLAFGYMLLWSESEMVVVEIDTLEEDLPNIYEIPGGTGCVAPDAAKSRYGVALWPSRDGVYMMDSEMKPFRVSEEQASVFGKMSYETHGGSMATLYDSMYDIYLLSPDGLPVGSKPHWRFDLLKPHWNSSSIPRAAITEIIAPLGHADYGVPHPVFVNLNPSINDGMPYIGEYTTADAGASYDCIGDIHFGPPGFNKFAPRRFAAYYQSDAAWAAPVISAPPGAVYIFTEAHGFGTPTPKSGTDYKVAVANAKKSPAAQDIVVRFKATSSLGGTANKQRLIAGYLDGKLEEIHPTG